MIKLALKIFKILNPLYFLKTKKFKNLKFDINLLI